MKIYIRRLSPTTDEDKLNRLFTEYGRVAAVRIFSGPGSRKSERIAIVEMPNRIEADTAYMELRRFDIRSRDRMVGEAKTQYYRRSLSTGSARNQNITYRVLPGDPTTDPPKPKKRKKRSNRRY